MSQPSNPCPPRIPVRAAAAAILAVALVSASLAGAATQPRATKRVAKEVHSPALGKTVLATAKGRTLYSLSAEKHGKFICTASCRSAWPPLLVPAGVKPTGPVKFGTIVRPEGGTQVTWRGRPLYRFSGDVKAGQANGEGIEDVGTWHAATVPQAGSDPQPQPTEPTPPYPPVESPAPYPTPVETPPYQPPYDY